MQTKNVTDRLAQAVVRNDVPTAQALLRQGANPNARLPSGSPLLSHAAEKGFLALMRLLLASGATVDERDIYGQTPLMAAASDGKLSAAKFLIGRGADVNAREDKTRKRYGAAAFTQPWGPGELKALVKKQPLKEDGYCVLDWAMIGARFQKDKNAPIIQLLKDHGAKSMELRKQDADEMP